MAFIQIVDFTTTDFDGFMAASESWWTETEGKRTLRRMILARDRNDPDHYVELVFFDSYESAMENSELPETQAAVEREGAYVQGFAFVDLEVIEDRAG